MATYKVTAGWTSPLDFDLLAKGTTPSGTLSGATVTLILKDRFGNQVTTTGDVTVQDEDDWVVRYSPDAADLTPGIYEMRFKVTDTDTKDAYFPSGDPDILEVTDRAA